MEVRNGLPNSDKDKKWETVKEYLEDVGVDRICVRVTRSVGLRRHRYSTAIGRIAENGLLVTYLRNYTMQSPGKSELVRIASVIHRMLSAAEDYIQEQLTIKEEELIDEMQQRETKRLGAPAERRRR